MFGLKKGAIQVFHVRQLTQVFCRFTVHREAIRLIRYLSKTKTFVSFCEENNFKVWQILPERRVEQLKSIWIEKTITKIHPITSVQQAFQAEQVMDRFLFIF